MEAAAASTEITVLGWSVILLIVHIVLQTLVFAKDAGAGYALSNREDVKSLSPLTNRLTRSLRNFVEVHGAFVARAVTGKTGGLGATGADLVLSTHRLCVGLRGRDSRAAHRGVDLIDDRDGADARSTHVIT
jgi:uncharacterized MAPEG superfamily protein